MHMTLRAGLGANLGVEEALHLFHMLLQVMCAHKDQAFMDAAKLSAEQVSAQPGTSTQQQQQQHVQAGATEAHAAGLSGMLVGAGSHTEEQSQASGGLSDSRHRNSSTVSLCSLAGSDISNCSSTYVTELPEGFSLVCESLD